MLPDIHRATQKFYIFLIVYLTGCTPFLLHWASLCHTFRENQHILIQRKEEVSIMFDLISISEAIKRSYDSEGLLVDVRSEEVFKKGHLPMAVNLPFEEIMNEKFDIEAIEKDFNIEKEQPVFLYCDTGSTSILAARKLDSMGIHAYNVVGGIMFYKGYLEKEKNDLWTMVRTS